jgi:hypothetical protein
LHSDTRQQVGPFLPEVFQLYVRSLRKHSSTLFLLPSSSRGGAVSNSRSAQEAHSVLKLRSSAFFFFDAVWPIAASLRPDVILQLLRLVELESLYATSSPDAESWRNTFSAIARQSADFKDSGKTDSTLANFVVLLRLDGALVGPFLPSILRAIASAKPTKAHEEFTTALLSYYAKTRALPSLLVLILETIDQVITDRHDRLAAMNGPLAGVDFTGELEREIARSLLPTQVVPVFKDLLARFSERLGTSEEQERPKKKRRVSKANDGDEAATSPFHELSVAHILAAFFNAAPVSMPDMETVKKMATDFCEQTLLPSLERRLEKGSAGESVAIGPILRVWISLSSKLSGLANVEDDAGLELPDRVAQQLASLPEVSSEAIFSAEEKLQAVSRIL